MKIISKILLLLAFTQLTACAVMSKQECLDADWRQVGYGVGSNGDTDISDQFNRREQTCVKHGTSANWKQFQQGHSDGLVQYCQLANALELGASGHSQVIDNQVCAERDYPGFREAFNVGYQLHMLRSRVRESDSALLDLSNSRDSYEQSIRHIRHQLREDYIEQAERKRLRYRLRENRDHLYNIDREEEQYRRRLRRDQAAANRYADEVYDDYVFSVSDRFIDPRVKNSATDKPITPPKQSEFDDRIDDILNQ